MIRGIVTKTTDGAIGRVMTILPIKLFKETAQIHAVFFMSHPGFELGIPC